MLGTFLLAREELFCERLILLSRRTAMSRARNRVRLDDALGVDREMPQEDLKRVYRALAKEHHPDRRRDSGAAMVRINEAYAVLQDPAARRHYDRILKANV